MLDQSRHHKAQETLESPVKLGPNWGRPPTSLSFVGPTVPRARNPIAD